MYRAALLFVHRCPGNATTTATITVTTTNLYYTTICIGECYNTRNALKEDKKIQLGLLTVREEEEEEAGCKSERDR